MTVCEEDCVAPFLFRNQRKMCDSISSEKDGLAPDCYVTHVPSVISAGVGRDFLTS